MGVEDTGPGLLGVDGPDMRRRRQGPLDHDEAAASARLQAALFGDAEPAEPASTIGRYRIVRLLGRGGMGEVYEAIDSTLQRTVAVKVLHGRDLDPRRLRREAQSLAQLSDPHIVGVYDVGVHEDQGSRKVHIVLEYVEGVTLDAWAEAHRPDWRQVLDVMIDAGRGLGAAHRAGIVHRDFKPANVLIDDKGAPRVLDFGLACAPGLQGSKAETADDELPQGRLTLTGAVLGTPAYMAPEQHAGAPADERSDQYSFCVALYEALFRTRPFRGQSVTRLVDAKLARVLPWDPEQGVPSALRDVLLRGLSVEPSARYPTMDHLLRALEGVQRRRPWKMWALGGVAGLGILSAVALGDARSSTSACDRLTAPENGVATSEELAHAFEAAGGEYGAQTWGRIERPLEDYTHELSTSINRWCETQDAEGSASSPMHTCLASRREGLSTLRRTFAEPDTEVLARAVVAVRDLPAVDTCPDVEDQLEPAAPESQRAALVRADALLQAGRYAEALETLDRLETELQSTAVHSRVLERRGSALRQLGHAEEAVETLESAFHLAQEAGAEQVEFDSALEVGFVLAYQLDAFERATKWVRHADAALARLDATPHQKARLLKNRGVIRYLAGDPAAATDDLEEALALFESVDPESPSVADTLQSLTTVYSGRGELEKALKLSEREAQMRGELFGSEHPSMALTLHTRGVVRARLGQTPDALDDLRSALRVRRRRLAPGHADIASSLGTIAALVLAQGDYKEATALYTEAYDVAVASGKGSEVRSALTGLGVAAFRSGDHDTAIRRYHQVVESAREAEGVTIDEVYARGNLANTLATTGRLEEARKEILRAVEVGGQLWGARSAELAQLHSSRARIELLSGNLGLAKSIAMEAGQDAHDAGSPVIERGLQLLRAEVEQAQGDNAQAARTARSVLKAAEEAGDQRSAAQATELLRQFDER